MTLKEAKWLVENALDEAEAKANYEIKDKLLRKTVIDGMSAVIRKAVDIKVRHK